MESNINLTSLKEISDTQLEALLRFDSPPETPAQSQRDEIDFSRNSIQRDFSKSELEANTNNSIIYHNHDQLISQMNSPMQYSIFNDCSSIKKNVLPSLNTQGIENDFSFNAPSQMDAEILDITLQNNDKNYLNDIFVKSTENEIVCKLFKDHGEESFKESNCDRREEYNYIFDNNVEYDLNLAESCRDKQNSNTNRIKCQTQLELGPDLKHSCDKRILSCPANTEKHYLSTHISKHTQELYANYAKSSSQISLNCTELNFDYLSDITAASANDNNNKDPNIYTKLSVDKNPDENTEYVDDIFAKSDSESVSQAQPHTKVASGSQVISKENVSNNESQLSNILRKPENMQMMDVSSIPIAVKQLYDLVKTNYSDFAFVYALSSQLCQERVPMDCFVPLKMALLLSLVSIGNNEFRPPIPIIAITNDTYMTDYLMSSIGQLGTRFLGPVVETKSVSNANFIEADPILLARGGVYYAGDWARLKIKRAEAIFKNLECSTVTVEKSTQSLPLETAIWTYWRSFKYGAKDQQTFNKFLKIFGIPIFVSDDNHEALVDYTLEQSSVRIFESTVDHLSINEDDMRNFLIYVSQHNVDLTPESALLLRNYFVASRSIRPDCLSQQSYAMLKQFAESFAKLSMRKVVLYDDALAAIIMFEHFIENICSSPEKPAPHFGNFTFVGIIDEYLVEFTKWLNFYIENFSNE